MQFFIPAAENSDQAESIYFAIAKFNNATVNDRRIYGLSWRHKGQSMSCYVGQPLPAYFGTGNEPVLAILDQSNHYVLCTANRGGLRGEPVLAGKDHDSLATYFTNEA